MGRRLFRTSLLGGIIILIAGFGQRNPSGGGEFVADMQLSSSGGSMAGMSPCGSIPSSAQAAFQKMRSYKQNCPHIRNSSKPMAINDYSSSSPMIYVFSSSGSCLGKAPIAWGVGRPKISGSKPLPCAEGSSNLTPPGFHLTASHNGGKYGSDDALKLIGLDGQRSLQRAILIHKKGPIGATTWGCTGVNPTAFTSIQRTLGTGSLVYNYFGSTGKPGMCDSSAGMNPNPSSCLVDSFGGGPAGSSRGYRSRTRR